mgnify:CR=1 FL=1|tara:strand:- start:5910 stop:6197 length:288 start_codon:yes stop_codon:yes gene_type:complete
MIDTDKYEGHAKEGWHFDSAHVLRDGYDKEIAELVGEDWLDDEATQKLIADAPLLLEAYKELSEWKAEVERICRTMNGPNRDTALFIMTNEVEEE